MSIDPAPLTRIYRAAAPDASPLPDEEVLRSWVERARAAWPEIEIPTEVFVAHLARCGSPDGAEPLHVVDLYLACACRAAHRGALAALESHCLAEVAKAIWQVGAADRDDVLQSVRELLLVGGSREPLIARYAGRGSLRGWVRSVALRMAIKHARRASRMVPLGEPRFLEIAASSDDPSLAAYKQRYRDEFRAAFEAAVEALSVRQRNVLRQYFLDQMTIDELGALYRVHRATAARWIQEVRIALVGGVRRALRARLPDDDLELRHVIELIASQLELSLERLLGADE